jgi:N-ethylmaleimide reductase
VRLGRLILPNRFVMAPLTRSRASADGLHHPLAPTYYAQRASAGLIVSEATAVSRQGSGYPHIPGLFSDAQQRSWSEVGRAVHGRRGRLFVQLNHTGRVGHSSVTGEALVSASAVPLPETDRMLDGELRPVSPEVPRPLGAGELPGIAAAFAAAAVRAMRAGADGVEIHAANGYLLDQFLRDGTNRRSDGYGGSAERRLRLLLEVVEAVSRAVGRDCVGVRLSPFNPFNGMSDSDPHTTFTVAAAALGSLGLAYLHVIRDHDLASASATRTLERMRRAFRGPLIANRGYDAASAEAALQEGRADAIAFGIPFIANPDLVRRLRLGLPLAEADPATFYGGGAAGYTDYPSWGPSPGGVSSSVSSVDVSRTVAYS